MKLFVGTSGFAYKEWKGSFYPDKMKNEEMLAGEELLKIDELETGRTPFGEDIFDRHSMFGFNVTCRAKALGSTLESDSRHLRPPPTSRHAACDPDPTWPSERFGIITRPCVKGTAD